MKLAATARTARSNGAGDPGPGAADEPRLSAWVRPLLYTVVGGLLAAPLLSNDVSACVALGAGVGAVVGRPAARSRMRLPVLWSISAAVIALSLWLRALLSASPGVAAWLGPAGALAAASAIGLSGAALGAALALRVTALRFGLARVLEVALVAVAFGQLVAAHRNGAINRPFELADSIIATGGDPTVWLLAIGGLAAAVSALLLLGERSVWRSLLHMLVALLLLSTIITGARMAGLPQPTVGSSGLGLRPDDEAQKSQDEGGRPDQQQQRDEELEFRDEYPTAGRTIPLAVVLLHDDYSPPAGLYYFRQSAFSQFNGKRLVAATRGDVDEDLITRFVLGRERVAEVPNAAEDRVTLETTVALLADHNRPFALEAPIELRPEDNPDPGRFRRVYRVVSQALQSDYVSLLGRGVGDPRWTPDQLAHYLGYPDDERYDELAAEIVREVPEELRHDTVARAVMVSLWLSREGIYSLRSRHASAPDPTAHFLFGDRTGYCVHFAHAAVYLMRSLGIPSRVGTGYAIEESARRGGSAMLLSGANSHAWPEVYVEGVGWVVLDVAPERTLDPPPPPPDADLQRLLGEMARGLDPLPMGEERPFEPVIRLARDAPAFVLRLFALSVLTLLVLAYAVKLWRRMIPWMVPTASAAPLAYRAQLDRLSDVAIRRRFGESRERFAARHGEALPSLSEWTRGQVARAFAAAPVQRPRRELRALSRSLRRELSASVPLRRRLLGLLDPLSWIWTR